MITNCRRQYAVGQGCFHASLVSTSDHDAGGILAGEGIRYVYDCGSMKSYAAARAREISEFHNDCARKRIDLLFLSHLHEDHVSGAEALCDPKTGCDVDTVVLPFLNVIDRLICFARAEAESDAGAGEFMAAVTVNPAAALARLNPRQIIFVRRGEGPAAAPGEGLGPGTEGGPFDGGGGERSRRETKWTLGGRGAAAQVMTSVLSDNIERPGTAEAVYEVDDTRTFEIRQPSGALLWVLAPYVDVEVSLARDAFLQAAADLFGLTPVEFEAKAADPAWLLVLVTQYGGALGEAYETVANLNVTSLCLYSGPVGGALERYWEAQIGALAWREHGHRLGWLGTGDADLKKLARREAFLAHYDHYLAETQTLLLPHHGSAHNFAPDLLDKVAPELTVAAADAYSDWKHPGSAVVQSVYARGYPLWTVTSSAVSRLTERVTLQTAASGLEALRHAALQDDGV